MTPEELAVLMSKIHFTVEKPAWWRRHTVMIHLGMRTEVIARKWSWDLADSLAERLNRIARP